MRRFLERVVSLSGNVDDSSTDGPSVNTALHLTVREVTKHYDSLKFNSALAKLMSFINLVQKEGLSKHSFLDFLKLLAPMAPHLTDELWEKFGTNNSIHLEEWPVYDQTIVDGEMVEMAVQVDGKLRDTIFTSPDSEEESVKLTAQSTAKMKKWLAGKKVYKIIFVPGRVINFLTE